MNIKPIKTEEDYQAALLRLELIFDAPIDTPQADEAEVLSLLIENYENEFYAIEAPDPIDAIRIRMEELNLNQSDLVQILGKSSRITDVLNRKRKLSLEMIRIISEKLRISASVLVKDYKLAN